jgi:hypothetical protein
MATTILFGPDTTDTLRFGDAATDSLWYMAETGAPGFEPVRAVMHETLARTVQRFTARAGETTTVPVRLFAGGVLADTEGHDITWTASTIDNATTLTGQGETIDGITTLTFDVPTSTSPRDVLYRLWVQVDTVHTWPTSTGNAGFLTLTVNPNV